MEDMKQPVRLLICSTCRSVEELPPYSGDPRGDTWLRMKEAEHLTPSGEKLHGDVRVGRIEQADWIAHKDEILNKLASEFTTPGEGAGFGQAFYDTKDNFSVDAMKCWRVEHGRRLNCEDYMSEKKRLQPDTRAERKAEGMDSRHRPSIYLCQFCPVHQHIQQKKASEEFGYNYDV
jgi:hypothetical protein